MDRAAQRRSASLSSLAETRSCRRDAKRRRRKHRLASLRIAAAATVVFVAMLACGGQSEERPQEPGVGPELPSWLLSVYPEPGAQMTSVSLVEVRHRVHGREQGVRLIVDGRDVTSSAETGRGRLHFDPDGPRSPFDLGSGRHTAEVRRVEIPDLGASHRVTDAFEWSFTVL